MATTLSANVSATDRVLLITGSTAKAKINNEYRIDDEVVELKDFEAVAVGANRIRDRRRWIVIRGANGSTPAAHSAGAEIVAAIGAFVSGPTLAVPDPFAEVDVAQSFDVRAYGAVLDGTTDDSTAMLATVAAWFAAGGGEILIPGRMRVDSQIVIPNDGATPPTQPPLRLRGIGAHFSGRATAIPAGAPFLDLRYDGTYGKLISNGLGLVEIEGLTFKDAAGTDTPFLYGTNTTWHVHDCAFIGSKTGLNCDQDAMVFGGTTAVQGGAGWNDGFQGYGTVIHSNYFGGIRRAVYGRVYFNGNVIRDNTVWASCGSNLAGGAAFEIVGDAGDLSSGNLFSGNLVEVIGYPYAFKFTNAGQNSIISNSVWDPTGGVTLACVRFEASAFPNMVIDGYQAATLAGMSDATAALNRHITYDAISDHGAWPIANFATGLQVATAGGELRGGSASLPLPIAAETTGVGSAGVILYTKDDHGTDQITLHTVSGYSFPYVVVDGAMTVNGWAQFTAGVAFYDGDPFANPTKPEITGSRGGNAALADLLTTLASLGLITDSSS